MPSIMNDENGRISWLHCNVKETWGDQLECHCQLFDGTPFTITVPNVKVQYEKGSKTVGWVQVIRHGSADHTVSVTLPAPSTRHGSRVRVAERQLVEVVNE